MDKKESLKFLQACINGLPNLSSNEIDELTKRYEENCTEQSVSTCFEFVPPLNSSN